MNKNIYQLFFSVVVGIGLGFALTYALNVYANSSLTSSLAVDWGAVFNNAGSNKVIIDNSGNVTVSGTVSAAEMQIGASNVCRADGTNCPSYSAGTNLSLSGNTFNVVSSPTFSGDLTVNGVTTLNNGLNVDGSNLTVSSNMFTMGWIRAIGSVEIEGKFIRNYGVFSGGQVYCSPLTLTTSTTFTCANPMVRVIGGSSVILNGLGSSASAACLALGGNGVVNSSVTVNTNGSTRGVDTSFGNNEWSNIQNCTLICSTPYITSLVCNY